MNNKLTDLNNHLFAALERLNEEDLEQDKLDFEVNRTKAVTSVAKTIIDNASLMLDAQKHFAEIGIEKENVPSVLRLSDSNEKISKK